MTPFDLALVLDTLERLTSDVDVTTAPTVRSRPHRDRVVDACLSEASLERRTAALGAWVAAIALQVAELLAAEPDFPLAFRPTTGAIRSVADLEKVLRRRVKLVCEEYAPASVAPCSGPERIRAMVALANAEQFAVAIGMDPDIACFIAVGASVRSDQLRSASRALAALLGIELAERVDRHRVPKPARDNVAAPTTTRGAASCGSTGHGPCRTAWPFVDVQQGVTEAYAGLQMSGQGRDQGGTSTRSAVDG